MLSLACLTCSVAPSSTPTEASSQRQAGSFKSVANRAEAGSVTEAAKRDPQLMPVPSSAMALKGRSTEITGVTLWGCDGKKVARMAQTDVRLLKKSIAHGRLAEGALATTPPWEALFEIEFSNGPTLYAQLVGERTLRVEKSRACEAYRPMPTAKSELLLARSRFDIYDWIERRLGKTQVKEYLLPEGTPPPGSPAR